MKNGKEKFAPIEIVAKVERDSYRFSSREPAEITLYVCPRCGTLRSNNYGVRYGL